MPKSKNFPRWVDQNMDKLNQSRFYLLDHPKYWKIAGLPETKIWNSGRLTKLMNGSRNLIVTLLQPLDLALQFCCSNCNEVHFPWAPVPRSSLGHELTYSHAAFLCKQGHPICRTCYESFCRCVFNEVDYCYNSYQQAKSTQKSRAAESVRQQYLKSVHPYNFGMWEDANICLMQKSAFKCMFLTNMIRSTDFPCKHFDKGCSFRGRGSFLQNHEENYCHLGATFGVGDGESQVATFSEKGAQQYQHEEDDDDDDILKLKMEDIVSEARSMILSYLEKYGNRIAAPQLLGVYT